MRGVCGADCELVIWVFDNLGAQGHVVNNVKLRGRESLPDGLDLFTCSDEMVRCDDWHVVFNGGCDDDAITCYWPNCHRIVLQNSRRMNFRRFPH